MKYLLSSVLLFFAFTSGINAQSCFNISAGPDIYTSCATTVLDMKARIPNIKSSEDYKIASIPYTPYRYVVPGGTTDPLVDADDHFSDSFLLPFPFCFYGNVYTKLCVGSNGVLTFDVKENAKTEEGYLMRFGDKLPFQGGVPNNIEMFYAPRASIFLSYYDMNPATSPTEAEIQWRVEGTAPCRRFVVSFYHIGYFDNGPAACPNTIPENLCTMQAVLYEGTGLIDVFYENKPACIASQNGLSIAGLQNWEQEKAVVDPARNGEVWSAVNEGVRYIPNGTTSLLNRVELYKNNILVPTTYSLVDLGTGEFEVTFPGITQLEVSADYVIKAFYKQCDNPAAETEGSDTVAVIKTLNPVDVTPEATSCAAINDGELTVVSPTAANIEYSLDGIAWQTSPVFTGLAPATYTITARVIGSTCTGETTKTITSPPAVVVSTNVTDPTCPGSATGTITVTNPAPGADMEYSIDGGTTWQASAVFSVTDGSYTIISRKISTGCIGTSPTITVTDPAPIPVVAATTPATCNGSATGTITVTPTGTDYEYSIDGGSTWQASPIFTVAASTYTVMIRQISVNCTNTTTATVTEPTGLTASAIQSKLASCANNDGEITVTVTGGTGPYGYSIDNGATYQSSNIITGLATGTYNKLKVKDDNGCEFIVNAVNITLNDTMRLELGPDSTICAGQSIVLVPQTNPQTNIFTWTPNNGTLSSTTGSNPTAMPTDTTKYYLAATFGICNRRDSIIINILHKPVSYAGKDTIICNKTEAFLHGVSSNLSGPVYYSWAPDTKLTYTTIDSSRATVRPDSSQKYAFIVKDGYGCNFTTIDSMLVTVRLPVPAFAGNDTIGMYRKPHQLKATGGVNYLWTPSAPLDNPFKSDPVALLSVDTYFQVWVTDDIGCKAMDDIFIKVYEGPTYYVPNAFTPDGNGINDIFVAVPSGIRSTEYFRIFDRYGNIVFETRQYMKGWDGTFKGKPQPAGTYVWIIKGITAGGMPIEDKGSFILIR